MTTEQQQRMHTDHRDAETEIDSWIDDVYMWSAEHKQALAWLSQIQAAIHRRDVELQQHRSEIDKLERHVRQHEHEIAMQAQKGESRDDTTLAKQHADFNRLHDHARKSHASIGDHHRRQIADLRRSKEQLVDAP